MGRLSTTPPEGRAWRYGLWLALAVAYLYAFPYFPRIHSANELPRAYLVQAIVDEHTFAIDRGVARWGATADVSPSRGHQYSNKAPGSSLLAVPAYAIARAVGVEPGIAATIWLCRVVSGVLPMLAFLLLLWRWLARFAPDPDVRRLVIVAYALGSLAMTYSILFYSHQLGAICIASAWIFALDAVDNPALPFGSAASPGEAGLVDNGRARTWLIAGALAGAAPLVDYQAVFAALPIAIHVLVRLPRGRRLVSIALATAGAALPIAVLLAYHAACFGSPWRTGYDASTTFAMYHQQGFLGITQLRGEAFWGSLFRIDNGLFALSPWLLLALPGFVALWRSGARGIASVGAGVAVLYVLFISSINFWRGGWGVGPRYIAAMLPFLLPAVAAQLQAWRARPLWLGAAAGLVGVGLVVYAVSSVTFPYWPDSVRHPLYDVMLRLVRDGAVAANLGSVLGVPGLLGLAPYAVATFGLWGAVVWRLARGRGLALAVAVAVAIVVTYGQLPHGEPRADSAYRSVRAAVLQL